MIIGIDGRVLQEGTGGVFVYAKNLLEKMIPFAKKHKIKIFLNQYHRKISKAIDGLSKHENVKLYKYRFPNKFLNCSFKFFAWPDIDYLMHGCDALFFPSMLYSSWSKRAKAVLTMHDLSYEFFPECFTAKQRAWHYLMDPKSMCKRASKIIAVSKSTKTDIAATYGIEEKKIKTIYSGIDRIFHPVVDAEEIKRVRNKYRIPEGKYILQVGTFEPRKNHIATIDAFSKRLLEHTTESKDWHLLFAGHNGWKTGKIIRAIKRSSFRDRIHVIRNFSSSDLSALYSLSSFSVYPSFYEGFGFPVLESMACGVPVIASSNSSIGEVVSDSGLLVNPYRIDEIMSAMRSLALDRYLAKSLRAKGLARSTEFTWEKTAKDTLKVIESV